MRDYTASVTDDQRAFMQALAKPFTRSMEVRSNNLRDWYNKGQQMFRTFLGDPAYVSDLEFDNDLHREGFLMGWNSDREAVKRGLELSVLGGVRYETDIDFTETESEDVE